MFFFMVWFWDKLAELIGGYEPAETKWTEIPCSLETAINLAVVPLSLLALAGLIYSRY
jgi:hypothetical protein